MLFGILLALASVQASAQTAYRGPAGAPDGGARRCAFQGGALVPTAQVAREIAEAIVRRRLSPAERAMLEMTVEPAGSDAWNVNLLIPDRREKDGSITHTDGGGLAIRIDRCNGAVLFFQYVI